MLSDKRMVEGYEITQTFEIGKAEIVLGEKPNAPDNMNYLIANCENNGIFTRYNDVLIGDDFAELAKIFAERIAAEADRVMEENAKISVDKTPLTAKDCEPVDYSQSIKDKVVVINADVFKPEYRMSVNQIYLCTGGFGSSENSRGTACFCTNLYTGESAQFKRQDVIGTLEKDKLSDWAKEGLEKVLKERTAKRNSRDAR